MSRLTRRVRALLYVQSFWVLIILLVIAAAFTLGTPSGTFLSVGNLTSMFADASELVILTVGATFVLIAAGIDLSVGSVIVLDTVITAKLVVAIGASPGALILAGLVAMSFGTACGILNGALITKLHLPSFIATLATLGGFLGIAQLVSGGTNVAGIPTQFVIDMNADIGGIPIPVFIAAGVALIGGIILNYTAFGQYTFAIGSSIEASRRAGIRVDRHNVAIYGLMGLVDGIVAFVDIGRFGVASIAAHSTDSLQAIAGAVIGGASLFGGRGSIFGAILGGLIPASLNNGFVIAGFQAYWQEVAVAVVLVVAVSFDQWRRRRALSGRTRRRALELRQDLLDEATARGGGTGA